MVNGVNAGNVPIQWIPTKNELENPGAIVTGGDTTGRAQKNADRLITKIKQQQVLAQGAEEATSMADAIDTFSRSDEEDFAFDVSAEDEIVIRGECTVVADPMQEIEDASDEVVIPQAAPRSTLASLGLDKTPLKSYAHISTPGDKAASRSADPFIDILE
ncbi:MAG: hypothetical protein WC890_04065 [Candidatus Margulisiibacteriota bacterium]